MGVGTECRDAYGKSVNHGFKAEVDFAGANNLGNILFHDQQTSQASERDLSSTHAGVIGL